MARVAGLLPLLLLLRPAAGIEATCLLQDSIRRPADPAVPVLTSLRGGKRPANAGNLISTCGITTPVFNPHWDWRPEPISEGKQGQKFPNMPPDYVPPAEPVVDCDKRDIGSCGNACCLIEVRSELQPETIAALITHFLELGGIDDSYRRITSKMPYSEHKGEDLRELNLPDGFKFIFQGTHVTGHHMYLDNMNFNIRKVGEHSLVRAFSISDLHGALADYGQNFKNLQFMLEAIDHHYGTNQSERVRYGCGRPLPYGLVVAPISIREASKNTNSTCGMQEEARLGCDYVDWGSCGNACCALEMDFDSVDAKVINHTLVDFLESGGPDGAYRHIGGAMPWNEHPSENLESLHLENDWKFIIQGEHTTDKRRYIDTLNFNIRGKRDGGSILRMFSISDQHGALSDNGQNFKSLAYLFTHAGLEPAGALSILHGCGQPIKEPENWET